MQTHEDADEHRGGTTGARRRCMATTKAGHVCGGWALRDDPDGLCWAHSQVIADRRKAGQRRGGMNTSARRLLLLGKVRFADSGSILQFREALASAALVGSLSPPRAQVALTAAQHAEAALFGAELERRVEQMEAQLDELLREEAGDTHERH